MYDKRDDLNFPIVDFLFISSNIPAAQVWSLRLTTRVILVYAQYTDFLDRAQLMSSR